MRKSTSIVFALVLAAGFAAPSGAAVKWKFLGGNCVGPCTDAERAFAPTLETDGDQGNDVSATAWANTDVDGANDQLAAAAVKQYGGGLGVINADAGFDVDEGNTPEHAMDNNERFDVLLFDFGDQQISLTELEIGYFANDRDISVLAWQGIGDPSVAGTPYSGDPADDPRDSGWTLIGNYDVNTFEGNIGGNDVYSQQIDTDVASSYWLVGAYNPIFGACTDGADICSYGDTKYDHVKLLSLKGDIDTPPDLQVPAPGSALLLAGGLPLLARRLRRRR